MRLPAIDDHVMVAVHSWYTEVAEWRPSDEVSASPCIRCRTSTLAESIDLDRWPHDIIHSFVRRIADVERDVSESYREEQEEGMTEPEPGEARALRLAKNTACARSAVADLLESHVDDVRDVLEQCLSERV